MTTPSEFNPGAVISGRYVIETLLGESPAARIYLADENHSRQKLCLKIYRPEISAQFLAASDFFMKAGVLPALTHDNLATVYEAQEWEGQVYVAREFLDGLGFEEWLRHPEHSVSRGLEMLWQAAQGLIFLHEKAYHLNLHPGNLFLSGYAAKIADPDPRMISGNDLISTPLPVRTEYQGYLAPEIRRGGTLAYPATDLYGLAGMFFRLLTGTPPAENSGDIQRHLNGLGREIRDFLNIALHPNLEKRFQSAETFADALWALQPFLEPKQPEAPAAAGASTFFGAEPPQGAAHKTEVYPPLPPAAGGTLFGKPLSSLEAPVGDGGGTLFGGSAQFAPAPPPETPKSRPQKPIFPPAPTPPKPAFSEPKPSPKPVLSSLTSLESDSPDLTLSGAGPTMTQYGFKGANPNQTLALDAMRRKKSRKVLFLSLAASALVLIALTGLFFVLRNASKKTADVKNFESSETKSEGMPPPQSSPTPAPATPSSAPAAPPPAPAANQPPFPEAATAPVTPAAPQPAAPASGKPPVENLLRDVKAQNWPATAAERLEMGDDLNDYGQVAPANAAYSKAMEIPGITSKEKIHALGGLAVTFHKMGMRDETINALDQLLALQPANRFAKDLKAKLAR